MRKNELHPRTKVLNQQQKCKSRQARQTALTWLTQQFPKAFDTKTSIYALQIGIMQDILQHAGEAEKVGISKAKLRQAVVAFTRRLDYLACLKTQGERINLQGEVVGSVSSEEAVKAGEKIKKWVEKSIKNQKKNLIAAPSFQNLSPRTESWDAVISKESMPKKTEVLIKTRGSKAFDPEAVLRLKSKLGINKKLEGLETS